MSQVKPIPDGYHTLTPYLIFQNASAALAFYAKAFGAVELFRLSMPDGKVAHSEMQLGSSRFMMADESPACGAKSPQTVGGSPVNFMIYLENVDTAVQKALDAGATVQRPLANQFYGDRTATLADPFGYSWTLATHVEDVAPDELDRRAKAMMGG